MTTRILTLTLALALMWMITGSGAISAAKSAKSVEGGPYTADVLKTSAPDSVAPALRAELRADGLKVAEKSGTVYAELWWRKVLPVTAKPAGTKDTVLYPTIKEGEFLGVLRFIGEGFDFRDQPIPAGVYTMRYGLQPVDGAHLGVSPFRDYILLVPVKSDTDLAPIAKKPLQERSNESSGTTHPAILMMGEVTEKADDASGKDKDKAPAMIHDQAKDTWGVITNQAVSWGKTDQDAGTLRIKWVVVGHAAE